MKYTDALDAADTNIARDISCMFRGTGNRLSPENAAEGGLGDQLVAFPLP